MSLFKDLGIDPDDFEWQQLAACAEMDTNWFYDQYESDETHARNADKICFGCPVMKACAQEAIDNKEEGLWGGVYWSNGKVDKARNKHKTKEDWEWVAKVMG